MDRKGVVVNIILMSILKCCMLSINSGDNDLYIAGGDSFGNSVSSVYKWCPEDNQFEDITGMHTPRKQ